MARLEERLLLTLHRGVCVPTGCVLPCRIRAPSERGREKERRRRRRKRKRRTLTMKIWIWTLDLTKKTQKMLMLKEKMMRK